MEPYTTSRGLRISEALRASMACVAALGWSGAAALGEGGTACMALGEEGPRRSSEPRGRGYLSGPGPA